MRQILGATDPNERAMRIVTIDIVEERAALLTGHFQKLPGGFGQFARVSADRVIRHIQAEFLRRLVVLSLAEHRDQVAGVMQLLVEGAHLRLQREEAHRAIAMGVESGLHDLTNRLADGNGGIGILKTKPLRH